MVLSAKSTTQLECALVIKRKANHNENKQDGNVIDGGVTIKCQLRDICKLNRNVCNRSDL